MTRTIVAGALALVLGGGCGPRHAPPGGGGGGGGGGGDGGGAGGGGGGGTGGAPAEAPLTEGECERAFDHVFAIGMAEQRAIKPDDYVPTEAQLAEIRTRMLPGHLRECLAWPRPVWACTLAATSMEALYACAGDRAQ